MVLLPIKRKVERYLKKIIIAYSLIKIIANIPPMYSILKPETISLSPSAISKGVRLDSAMHSVTHTKKKGRAIKHNHRPCCVISMESSLSDSAKNRIVSINRNKHTS
mgnify:CR=1 FL=1